MRVRASCLRRGRSDWSESAGAAQWAAPKSKPATVNFLLFGNCPQGSTLRFAYSQRAGPPTPLPHSPLPPGREFGVRVEVGAAFCGTGCLLCGCHWSAWSGSMAPKPPKRRRRVCMNSRRLSAYRDPSSRLGRLVLDEHTYREHARHCREHAVTRGEESRRVLKALIVGTQKIIEQSRALIAKIDEILAKRR